jgi:hypothetical protein
MDVEIFVATSISNRYSQTLQVRMSSANDAPIGVSPLAGKPATPAMLVDVPKLLTAFFIGAGAAGCVRHLGPSWVPL